MASYKQGEVLLAWLVFSDGNGTKRRPVLVAKDFGDDDILVLPITSHSSRQQTDIRLVDWKSAGLRLPSVVRAQKLATISKSSVERKMGALSQLDLAQVKTSINHVFKQILD
jgi:mRNA interferase MazF